MTNTPEEKLIIASRLRDSRKKAGYSRKKIAKIVDFSVSDILKVETGSGKIPFYKLGELADIYNVNLMWILGREENQEPEEG